MSQPLKFHDCVRLRLPNAQPNHDLELMCVVIALMIVPVIDALLSDFRCRRHGLH
jgi:hypothetical protein